MILEQKIHGIFFFLKKDQSLSDKLSFFSYNFSNTKRVRNHSQRKSLKNNKLLVKMHKQYYCFVI